MFNSIIKFMGVVAALMMVSIGAQGAERYILDMGDAHYRGNKIIRLKQEIRYQYGAVNLRGSMITSVRMLAKCKHGGGTATLMVNGFEQDRSRIMGNPRDFHNRDRYSYDRLDLNSHRAHGNGPWQIHLRGNIKVKRVVVVVEHTHRRPPRRRPLNYVAVGSARAPKLVEKTKRFDVRRDRVFQVVLNVTKKKVDFTQVTIEYANGEQESLYELQGTVRDGDSLVAHLYGRRVRKITVTSTSPHAFGSRGEYNLEVGVR